MTGNEGIYGVPSAIIGHRGSGKADPGAGAQLALDRPRENTADAMRQAFVDGADGVEFDIWAAADGVLVVHHDRVLPDGKLITDLKAAELLAKYGIETLDAVLAAVPDGRVANIEVKTGFDKQRHDPADPNTGLSIDHSAMPLLLEYHASGAARRRQLLISSFDPDVVATFANAAIPTALLVGSRDIRDGSTQMSLTAAVKWALALGAQAVHAETDLFPLSNTTRLRALVAEAHGSGIQLLAWCPKPKDAVKLLENGVDAVCVNQVSETVDRWREQLGR